ncbi:MAG: Flp pilus assembly complex ATPase component TadA [Alphaproteobacteria bacterium]|nr:Flp pilus assembly complex ATPase component TadA [Alphaproteobacteria bacterium]
MSANEVLKEAILPLANWYNQKGIEEVAINEPGVVWLRERGRLESPWTKQADPKLTQSYLMDILHIIANVNELPFDPANGIPTVYASLPGEHRFSAIAGKNVNASSDNPEGGIAIAIRVKDADAHFDFKNYGLIKGEALREITQKTKKLSDDPYTRLMQLIRDGENILISGATATGKTTFLNNILKLLNPNMRIITIEDTRELNVPQANKVNITLSRTQQTNIFSYKDVIDLVVRMSPDSIMGGEISTDNAQAVWELMNTGHSHFYATIHADSAEQAYLSFIDRILHVFPNLDQKRTMEQMRKSLHVVQIGREGGLRQITEII